MPGGPELFAILAVIVLLFGARKLPELSRGIGESIKEFRKATAEADEISGDGVSKDTTPRDSTS